MDIGGGHVDLEFGRDPYLLAMDFDDENHDIHSVDEKEISATRRGCIPQKPPPCQMWTTPPDALS